MKTVFKNVRLNSQITDITVNNGIIEDVCVTNENGFDLNGMTIRAGLIDIHAHGCIGHDTMDGSLTQMSEFMAKNGTTSWLPTTMTMDLESIKAVTNVDLSSCKTGAKVLGFHMEGPYISKKLKGCQNEKFIKNPNIKEFSSFKNIKMVTLAPELDGASSFIQNCDGVVSLGHSNCDYETAISAIENGAECITHIFNAMPPLNHREPALIGAAIVKNVYVQVICDGVHLHKATVLALYKMFGVNRMILISDAMRATGLGDGEYLFGGQNITVKNSIATTKDGVIAGSTKVLHDCVKAAISFGIPEADAYKMAAGTPARLLNVKAGEIKQGYPADFIVLDDNLKIKYVVIDGIIKNTCH